MRRTRSTFWRGRLRGGIRDALVLQRRINMWRTRSTFRRGRLMGRIRDALVLQRRINMRHILTHIYTPISTNNYAAPRAGGRKES